MTSERRYAGWTISDILNHKGPVGIPDAVFIELLFGDQPDAAKLVPQPPLLLRLPMRPERQITSITVERRCYGQPDSESGRTD